MYPLRHVPIASKKISPKFSRLTNYIFKIFTKSGEFETPEEGRRTLREFRVPVDRLGVAPLDQLQPEADECKKCTSVCNFIRDKDGNRLATNNKNRCFDRRDTRFFDLLMGLQVNVGLSREQIRKVFLEFNSTLRLWDKEELDDALPSHKLFETSSMMIQHLLRLLNY